MICPNTGRECNSNLCWYESSSDRAVCRGLPSLNLLGKTSFISEDDFRHRWLVNSGKMIIKQDDIMKLRHEMNDHCLTYGE